MLLVLGRLVGELLRGFHGLGFFSEHVCRDKEYKRRRHHYERKRAQKPVVRRDIEKIDGDDRRKPDGAYEPYDSQHARYRFYRTYLHSYMIA